MFLAGKMAKGQLCKYNDQIIDKKFSEDTVKQRNAPEENSKETRVTEKKYCSDLHETVLIFQNFL